MPTLALGRRTVAQIATVGRTTIFYDSGLKGFGLIVSPPSGKNPDGSRTWIVEYRAGGGGRRAPKRRVSIGSAALLTPERARQKAETMLAEAKLGEDHAATRKEARVAPTIAELSVEYAAATDAKRKASTVALYSLYWRLHIIPALGGLRARDVTPSQVARLHAEIGKTRQVAANRVTTLLAHFYQWAGQAGRVPSGFNPARGIDKFREEGCERYLSEAELGRLGEAIREAETIGVEWGEPEDGSARSKHEPKRAESRRTRISPESAAALRLLIFTGARLREILRLRWAEVDFGRGLLMLPDSKTGRKTVVLGAPALAILQQLRERAECPASIPDTPNVVRLRLQLPEYVIPGDVKSKPRADLKRPWELVRRRAGLEGVRLHDLRHTFASVGAGAGLGLPIIGGLLGHKNTSTTARYAHLDAGPLKRATDHISGTIADALASPGRGTRERVA